MNFLRVTITRLAYAALLLVAVLILNFTLMHLAPGDVADTIAQSAGGIDAEALEQIRREYGLDQPFIVQLGSYVGRMLQFDLGYSFFYSQPVTDLILDRLPATLLLVIAAQVLALVVGLATKADIMQLIVDGRPRRPFSARGVAYRAADF